MDDFEHRVHVDSGRVRYPGQEAIARLRAEVEAMRADAERYRWMRDNKAPELIPFPTEDGRWVAQFFPDGGGIHERTYKTLDAAIDAARAAQGER